MTKKKKRILFILIPALIIAGVVITSISSSGDEQTEVQADLTCIDNISEVVTASGRIQPKTKVNITSEVSAQIVQLYIKEGQHVNKNQPLLLLDTVQLNSDVEQARYSLDEIIARTSAAKSQFEKNKQDFDIQTSLREQNHNSETEFINARYLFDNSKSNYEAMQAQVKTARARLDKAEDNLTKTMITSPMNGVIIYLNAEIGEIAQAQTAFTQGKTLMTVADLAVFEVEVDIDETQIANLRLEQNAEVKIDAFEDSIFNGTVIEIGNSASVSGQGSEDFATTFRVKIRLDENEMVIRQGMSATVDITTATSDNALLIPYASVVTREFDPDSLEAAKNKPEEKQNSGNVHAAELEDEAVKAKPKFRKKEMIKKSGVYIIENGLAKFIEIKTGIADEQNIVVLNGLNPGDTVISGSFKTLRLLKEDDPVKIDQFSLDKMEELK